MDQFEQTARQKHKGLYDLIWEARKTEKKHLWFLVGLMTFIQLIWKSAIAGLVFGLLYLGMVWTGSVSVVADFVFIFIFASPVIEAILDAKMGLRNTSNMIAISGDMNRIRKGGYGFMWKIIATCMYILFGVIAVYSAFSVWMLKRKTPNDLDVSELDVLGTALSRAGFCHDAELIFMEIQWRYNRAVWHKGRDAIQCAVSYALACKWMIACSPRRKDEFLNIIQMVRNNYSDLPVEITMRLDEALNQ